MRRFLRYCVVGLSGIFVDLLVFHILRKLIVDLTRSTMLSAEVAIINNFLWNDLWTFGDISQSQQSGRQRLLRLLKFNAICLSGLILQTLIVNFLFNVLHINAYLAKLIAIASVTIWNFWFNLKLSWRKGEKKGIGGRV